MSAMMLVAIAIFLVTYVLILTEKIHRTVLALAGAALMIILGVVTQQQAIEGIDFNMLGILVGMMTIVGMAKHSGLFEYVAIWAARAGKGHPVVIFCLLALITMFFSSVLDDVTTVLLMVPVMFVIAHNLRISPKPFLFASIMMANIGGAATLIGDQPNILVGSAANLSFNEFLFNMAPLAIVIGIMTVFLLAYRFRKDLVSHPEAKEDIMKFKPSDAIQSKSLLIKSIVVLVLVVVGFITHGITGIEGATLALSGAALLLLLTLHEPEEYIRDIEWTTIFFFIGLFVLVTGLEQAGVMELLAGKVIELTGGNMSALKLATLGGGGFISAVVDNVPFVAIMIPLIHNLGSLTGMDVKTLWWSLVSGADFGGNATLIGASANVVVSGMAIKEGHKIGFLEYMKTAVPLVLLALLISTGYVVLRYIVLA